MRDVWEFLKGRKKWWLSPILLVLFFMCSLIYLFAGSSVSLFLYPLF